MSKELYIAEKPSVAQAFGSALHEDLRRHDGYLESDKSVVTWCIGHLVTMSYPDKYDEKYRRWSFETLPFLPASFRYEIIPSAKKQFAIVKELLNRKDIGTIYVCTDAGREGEYIYRLVAQEAGLDETSKEQRRVWIDAQTEEEILRGIREAKPLSLYDHLSDAAYLRAKEDYLMGINFSRALSIRYSRDVADYLGERHIAISAGRVMTCVLGMVVRREREIRAFQKTPFFRVLVDLAYGDAAFEAAWHVSDESRYAGTPKLYKESGFRTREDAEALIAYLRDGVGEAVVESIERKTEKKNPPLLFNLAELQNACSKRFKISPDKTLAIAQELYEKKLTTYPRTDARVLSSAIAKEAEKHVRGLAKLPEYAPYAEEILGGDAAKGIAKTRYTNDKQVTDHYAIIPTGEGLQALKGLGELQRAVFDLIVRRFLAIFYPPAQYKKLKLETKIKGEAFTSNFRVLTEAGYLKLYQSERQKESERGSEQNEGNEEETQQTVDVTMLSSLSSLKKGSQLEVKAYRLKEGETTPPRRYTSGSMILAMENAGQLIEDEELRSQIKGSGIGTSATRAEILKKLEKIRYLALANKTQLITPTQLGEMVYDVVDASIRPLLNAELTASWEKGLTYVANGEITQDEYMEKLQGFVLRNTERVRALRNQTELRQKFDAVSPYYLKKRAPRARKA